MMQKPLKAVNNSLGIPDRQSARPILPALHRSSPTGSHCSEQKSSVSSHLGSYLFFCELLLLKTWHVVLYDRLPLHLFGLRCFSVSVDYSKACGL